MCNQTFEKKPMYIYIVTKCDWSLCVGQGVCVYMYSICTYVRTYTLMCIQYESKLVFFSYAHRSSNTCCFRYWYLLIIIFYAVLRNTHRMTHCYLIHYALPSNIYFLCENVYACIHLRFFSYVKSQVEIVIQSSPSFLPSLLSRYLRDIIWTKEEVKAARIKTTHILVR